MPKRHTIDEICASVKKISNGKTKLISEEYVNNRTPLLFQCQCGNKFERSYEKFQRGRFKCEECSIEGVKNALRSDVEYIKKSIEKNGCKYISGKYENNKSKLYLQCSCGNKFYKSWGKFMSGQNRCIDCGKEFVREAKRKYYPENAKEILLQYGYIMIGDFVDGASKVECICSRGHKCHVVLSALISSRHTGCIYCAYENNSGEKSANYKGGISMLDDTIRKGLIDWKNNIRDLYNGECPITHNIKINTVVHHLTSLSTIYNDVIYDLGYNDVKLHDSITNNNLSEYDKNKIITEVVNRHNQSTGILVDKDIHISFHRQYGYGGNTPEQFDEFLHKNYNLSLSQIQVK